MNSSPSTSQKKREPTQFVAVDVVLQVSPQRSGQAVDSIAIVNALDLLVLVCKICTHLTMQRSWHLRFAEKSLQSAHSRIKPVVILIEARHNRRNGSNNRSNHKNIQNTHAHTEVVLINIRGRVCRPVGQSQDGPVHSLSVLKTCLDMVNFSRFDPRRATLTIPNGQISTGSPVRQIHNATHQCNNLLQCQPPNIQPNPDCHSLDECANL
mmetsp:Transcript_86519/g.231935  ORF Transcript_86519/g.231935 Transcript_86519/m.231935 type:complete len:210 (+) Transcript_86519:1102-1731(+)